MLKCSKLSTWKVVQKFHETYEKRNHKDKKFRSWPSKQSFTYIFGTSLEKNKAGLVLMVFSDWIPFHRRLLLSCFAEDPNHLGGGHTQSLSECLHGFYKSSSSSQHSSRNAGWLEDSFPTPKKLRKSTGLMMHIHHWIKFAMNVLLVKMGSQDKNKSLVNGLVFHPSPHK